MVDGHLHAELPTVRRAAETSHNVLWDCRDNMLSCSIIPSLTLQLSQAQGQQF